MRERECEVRALGAKQFWKVLKAAVTVPFASTAPPSPCQAHNRAGC